MKWTKRPKRRSAANEPNLDALLLHRICDVMLKAIKTGRPLVHLIKAWAIVGPHLIEVIEGIPTFGGSEGGREPTLLSSNYSNLLSFR